MPIRQLKAIGGFQPFTVAETDNGAAFVDRLAMLVYAGDFESADGPVTVTPEQLGLMVLKHNSIISRLKATIAGDIPLKHCPPVQLDHSTSARDTVGRLIGPLILGEHSDEIGNKVPAIFGMLRVLGAENVERVNDGRWTHLSLGADFDAGRVAELTITPFPAAAHASMLKRLKRFEAFEHTAAGALTLLVELDETSGKFHAALSGKPIGEFESEDAARAALRGAIVAQQTKLSSENTEGDGMKVQLKTFLTGVKKMSEGDADAHLTKLEADKDGWAALVAEEKAHTDKLSADALSAATAAAEAAQVAAVAKLTATKDKITNLSTTFKANATAAKLAATTGRVMTRLSRLRADAKITPAEIKKLDIASLAAKGDDAIELVLKTYADREPVIMIGQLGTRKATTLSQLSAKEATKAQIEADARKNMTSLTKLSAEDAGKTDELEAAKERDKPLDEKVPPYPGAAGSAQPPPQEDLAYFEREYGEICRMMDGGQMPEAKERLKAFMQKSLTAGAPNEMAETTTAETEKHLSALAESTAKMQANFDDLLQIASGLTANA